MHLEFLVEELSAKEFLSQLLPKLLPKEINYTVHDFQGKKDLLKKMPARLKGYKAWIPKNYKIIILIDKDETDCKALKKELEKFATDAGFKTKSNVESGQPFQVLTRIVIEELEAWFFGDVAALSQAYPKINKNLAKQAKYRDPDAIKGGTWETLEKLLQSAGYHQGGLEKVKAAREISTYMNPEQNTSKSFQVFYSGLLQMIAYSNPK